MKKPNPLKYFNDQSEKRGKALQKAQAGIIQSAPPVVQPVVAPDNQFRSSPGSSDRGSYNNTDNINTGDFRPDTTVPAQFPNIPGTAKKGGQTKNKKK